MGKNIENQGKLQFGKLIQKPDTVKNGKVFKFGLQKFEQGL
jgi:hypothetical protein